MTDEDTTVILDLLGRMLRSIQVDQREQRAELRDSRTLLLLQVDHSRRADRHMSELRDDLDMTIESELIGRLGVFETRLGRRFDELVDRVGVLGSSRPPA